MTAHFLIQLAAFLAGIACLIRSWRMNPIEADWRFLAAIALMGAGVLLVVGSAMWFLFERTVGA